MVDFALAVSVIGSWLLEEGGRAIP
ncbi:hypothetical protein AGR1A_Lc60058 [Agrobacterium fabacearum CFBP 5771]|nr:hypothetical protein AGR1A_Lc60058 [Agrobacterium fabacearum CFBP 5771]